MHQCIPCFVLDLISAKRRMRIGLRAGIMMTATLEQQVALYDEIAELKTQRNAIMLAHYYQDGAIQEIAEITGDSLKLAREAAKVTNPVIVFCGVHFMAETAKILNPKKT